MECRLGYFPSLVKMKMGNNPKSFAQGCRSHLVFVSRSKREEGDWMRILPVAIACIALSGCGWFQTKRYAAEVGYYAGYEVAWDLWGDYESLDECREAAIARYNDYVAKRSRAYSWSCLLKDGKGGFVERYR